MRTFNASIRQVVLATTPDDSHLWNLVGVQLELEERGFAVTNLGQCTPVKLIAETLTAVVPELLVISSINGHGEISIAQMLRELTPVLLATDTRVVAGGLLATDQAQSLRIERSLLSLGCSAVFGGDNAWSRFDAWLQTADSSHRSRTRGSISGRKFAAGCPAREQVDGLRPAARYPAVRT